MPPTTILTAVAIGFAIAWAAVLLFSWGFARWWCKPKRRLPIKTPADYGLPFQVAQFNSKGVPIKGWFIPAASTLSRQPAVVLAHSWSMNAREMLPLGRLLHDAGFAVLAYDARGHGASGEDGPITVLKLAEDITAGVEHLQTNSDIDRERLGVLGQSIGGSAAIVAASIEPRIRAVVSCSAFADPVTLTRNYLAGLRVPTWPFTWLICRFIERWLGTAMKDVAPKNRIGQVMASILLIHGGLDRFVPPSEMELLYTHAPRERTDHLLLPNRGHLDSLRDPESGRAIVAFFRRALSASNHRNGGGATEE